jgi:hypothetical protein
MYTDDAPEPAAYILLDDNESRTQTLSFDSAAESITTPGRSIGNRPCALVRQFLEEISA